MFAFARKISIIQTFRIFQRTLLFFHIILLFQILQRADAAHDDLENLAVLGFID